MARLERARLAARVSKTRVAAFTPHPDSADSRTRTGTGFRPADFPTTPYYYGRKLRCSLDYVFFRSGRWVYSLYTFTPIGDLARRCPDRIFAELAHIHTRSFLSGCSNLLKSATST